MPTGWRMSAASTVAPSELRIRMELQLPSDLQMLVMSRPLMEALRA